MGFITDADSDFLLCEQDGPVATITINRPEVMNTLNFETETDLHAALDRAVTDDSVKVIVLTGAGERAFSAGYDMSHKNKPGDRPGELLRHWWNIDSKTGGYHWHLFSLEKPVITAVQGWCLAGAFWYALASDVTIAADDAVFGQPEIRESQNSTALLAFLVGWKNAARYALTGDHFDAEEALRIGVVNEVVPKDELMERTLKLAHRMAMVPADSLRLNKRITSFAMDSMGLRTAMEGAGYLGTILHAGAKDSPEIQEMLEVRANEGMGASLKERDDKFRPEPGGPRSKPRK